MASESRLSKCKAQDRKRARERRASETAAQREVRLAKHRLQHTEMRMLLSQRGERPVFHTVVRCPLLVPVVGVIIDVRKLMSLTDTHNLVDQCLPVCYDNVLSSLLALLLPSQTSYV